MMVLAESEVEIEGLALMTINGSHALVTPLLLESPEYAAWKL